jgi:putative glutamine amidotransferase
VSPKDLRPLILVTQPDVTRADDRALATRKIALYHDAVRRAGGRALGIDELASSASRLDAFERMDGLLLTGGADLDPAIYGRRNAGSRSMQPGRDALEWRAFTAAAEHGLPVLGICRGLQAINAFSGGALVQHVDGHAGPEYGHGEAHRHPIRLITGSRLATILGADGVDTTVIVNSYHHQAVEPAGLAPGLAAAALAEHDHGQLVEGLEAPGERFVVGVQCHPERLESTPRSFGRLFEAFVAAATEG